MEGEEGGESNIFNQNENVNFGTGDDKEILSREEEEEENFNFGSPDDPSYAWWNEPDRN